MSNMDRHDISIALTEFNNENLGEIQVQLALRKFDVARKHTWQRRRQICEKSKYVNEI